MGMGRSGRNRLKFFILALHLCVAALSFIHCDATRPPRLLTSRRHPRPRSPNIKSRKHMGISKHLDIEMFNSQLDTSNTQPYVSSPFSMPPYDSLAPIPLPDNAPPYCIYPPFSPLPLSPPAGSGSLPPTPPSPSTPAIPGQSPSPPESGPSPYPPETVPGTPTPSTGTLPSPPPPEFIPSPTGPGLSPPYIEPSPPSGYIPNPPPTTVPSPPIFVPSPPVFLPPVVYPPPTVPPPPRVTPASALWCVAKPSVPDPIIQEALNYACGSGADCDSIQPNGSCFEPNTLFAHASYAFNSYWQRTKVAGGKCEFGGTAILVTVDPSYDGCHFAYY